MKRYLIGWTVALAVACASAAPPTLLERGSYLVNGVMACVACHTPKGQDGKLDMSRPFSGSVQTWEDETYKVMAPNITPDRETGIGKWSNAELKRTLLTGVRPNGTRMAPVMPASFYKVFTPRDIDAVIAYLNSLPAIHNTVTPPVYKAPMQADTPPGADRPMSEADMADPVRRGFYLATLGHCMECHTPSKNGTRDFTQMGRGGQLFKGPFGISVSRNITSHPVAGLGKWTDAQIKTAMTQGLSKDGSKLKPPMAYSLIARMGDADLNAIVAYLRTVPPRE